MPLKRLEKTRATLPSGYQYGDAASERVILLERDEWIPRLHTYAFGKHITTMTKRYDDAD